eukprot:351479-Chlamydomonas_euryale.AAC.10
MSDDHTEVTSHVNARLGAGLAMAPHFPTFWELPGRSKPFAVALLPVVLLVPQTSRHGRSIESKRADPALEFCLMQSMQSKKPWKVRA